MSHLTLPVAIFGMRCEVFAPIVVSSSTTAVIAKQRWLDKIGWPKHHPFDSHGAKWPAAANRLNATVDQLKINRFKDF